MGIEIKTYGHVFQLNFMNSKRIVAGQFIPFTIVNGAKENSDLEQHQKLNTNNKIEN